MNISPVNFNTAGNQSFKGIYLLKGKECDLQNFQDKIDDACRMAKRMPCKNLPDKAIIRFFGILTGNPNRRSSCVVTTNEDTCKISVYYDIFKKQDPLDYYFISPQRIAKRIENMNSLCESPMKEIKYEDIEESLAEGRFDFVNGEAIN